MLTQRLSSDRRFGKLHKAALSTWDSFADEAELPSACRQTPHVINHPGCNTVVCSELLGVWAFICPVGVVRRWAINPGHWISWKQSFTVNINSFIVIHWLNVSQEFLLSMLKYIPNQIVRWRDPEERSCSRTKRFSVSLSMVRMSEVLTAGWERDNFNYEDELRFLFLCLIRLGVLCKQDNERLLYLSEKYST